MQLRDLRYQTTLLMFELYFSYILIYTNVQELLLFFDLAVYKRFTLETLMYQNIRTGRVVVG